MMLVKGQSRYHPTDFVHGVLAAHCYEERMFEGDLVADSIATWSPRTLFNLSDKARRDAALVGWRVEQVFDKRKESDYVGVIYLNDEHKQIVVAHRVTSVDAPYVQDILRGFSGIVTSFQRQLRNITQTAVELAKTGDYSDYALSLTGYSLGGCLLLSSAVRL